MLLQPAPSQVVQLEPVTPLPSQLEQPAPNVQAINTPVSSIKPRLTKPIEPRRTPIIKAPTRDVAIVTTQVPEKPLLTRDIEKPVVTRESPEPTREIPPSTPNLTVRQDAGSWRVQAGAFRTESNAQALQSKIQASGLTARVVQGEDRIYRVLVGNYSTSEAARADSSKVLGVIR